MRRWSERIGLLVLVVGIYLLYFPLAHFTSGLEAKSPVLAIDRATSLSPDWMYIYGYVFLASIQPLFVVDDDKLFRAIARAYICAELVAFAVFAAYPVHMLLRPESVAVSSFSTWGLNLAYWVDPPTNCLPSMHVTLSTLAALCCWRVDRLVSIIASCVAVLICASTMLVKQHLFADVVAGLALAVVCYALFVARAKLPGPPRGLPRWVSTVVPGAYGVTVIVLYATYRAGWRPWEG